MIRLAFFPPPLPDIPDNSLSQMIGEVTNSTMMTFSCQQPNLPFQTFALRGSNEADLLKAIKALDEAA